MVPYGIFTFLFCLSTLLTSTTPVEHDSRYISFQDLQQSLEHFSKEGVTSYSQMLFDVARNQVLVGARDYLFRLSLTNLKVLESAEWPTSNEKRTQCIYKGQSDDFCHNYVKTLLSNGKLLFACGTNAFSPQCSKRKIENVSYVTEWVDGVAKCPYNPNANVTGFMSEQGEYYFGGPTDFSSSDYVVSKNVEADTTIRTKQYNSLWLNDPQFVGSFETENFVYFLFREAAVEYMNCGKVIYSRIARVCKNDPGGHTMLKDNWTTFLKARLNCSISGEYPFYFDEIQSMSYVPDENVVYATFSTPSNSIAGSAICAFNLSAIEAAFAGPFKYRENMDNAWGKHSMQHRDHFNCKSSPRSSQLLESSKYQLMDSAVQATTLNPLHIAQLERFTHITIDVLSTRLHTKVHVIYVSTTEGLLKKMSVIPRTQETCVVEVWQTVQDVAAPIRSIQFIKETKSVYVATEQGVMKISADHCNRHTSRKSCLNAMDPYCGWNERNESCSTAPNSDPLDKYWEQAIPACPVLDTQIDGGWSSWSSWAPCVHSDSEAADQCMCQTRECNNPAPKNSGRPCSGHSIAVSNCTVHGGWSDWSAWSACSATCGAALKSRTRTCSNPAPAFGGRVCVGQDQATAYCDAELPPCPGTPQDGGWGPWGEWSDCSSHCAPGCKKRVRRCDSPPPENGGQYCVGNDVDYKHECEEPNRKVLSSPLIISSNSTGEYSTRFKFNCRAPVKPHLIKMYVKEEVCINNNCRTSKENENPRWSTWEPWSECSVPCGGGTQNRTRHCEGLGCVGPSEQSKECNKHDCRGEWGCWSEWSPCNVSCGWGVRTRHRDCLGYNCTGSHWEKEPCEHRPCHSTIGWSNWTVWSLCDKNNEQHRKRQCRISNPGPSMCQGSSEETRMCIPDQLKDITSTTSESPKLASAGGVILFVCVGVVAGGVMGAAGMHVYHKKKRVRIPSSPHYMSSKQNPYITMPLQERPKKHSASTSNNILNNGTLKAKYSDYEPSTLKRNSHALNNGHVKQDLLVDDKFYYD